MALSDNYFKSRDVRVFPSSFRGTYDNTTFDPEARLNTEANFIVPKMSGNKASYIVKYTTNTISFVLGGYYFEINNLTDYALNGKYLNIKLRDIIIAENQGANNKDSERRTSLLDTWEADNNNDHILDSSESDTYYFSGLKISSISPETTAYASIKLFDDKGNINQEAVLVDIDHGAGANTLMHGVGLQANSTNQTVFGTYNDNKTNTLFEVGKGTETNRNNALEISNTTTTINNATNINGNTTITGSTKIDGTAEITNNTELKGIVNISNNANSESSTTGALKVTGGVGIGTNLDVGGDANLNNKLIVKTSPAENETNVKVDGTLNVTGKTDIYDNITVVANKTTLAKPVEITDTSDNALKVKGKTTLEKDLEVGTDIKVLTVKNSPGDGEQNVTVTGTLKSTDKATFGNGLEVAPGKITTLGGQVNITGAVNINTNNQIDPEAITIYGATTVNGAVGINGKATSTSTTSADENTTLTTKDYVDDKFNALDVAKIGADGKYLKTISETDGKITATPQDFDKTISDSSTDNNAPTSKAVKDYINTNINSLNKNSVGGKQTSTDANGNQINIYSYIASISQTKGQINATPGSIVTDLNTFDETSQETGSLPSAKTVKNYFGTKQTNLENDIKKLEQNKNLICLNGDNQYAILWANNLSASNDLQTSVSEANWEKVSLSDLSDDPDVDTSKWKIVNVVVSSIIKNPDDYSQQTWDFGKNEGDYINAENTMYWANSVKVWWSETEIWFLNTNAKRSTRYSYIVVLQKK